MNNDGPGAINPKTGLNATVINRAAGMSQAESFISSKTRSRYSASSKQNTYVGCSGYGDNENINGYGKK